VRIRISALAMAVSPRVSTIMPPVAMPRPMMAPKPQVGEILCSAGCTFVLEQCQPSDDGNGAAVDLDAGTFCNRLVRSRKSSGGSILSLACGRTRRESARVCK
jgi:hypothetical protein